jgi:small subunit ribosomal protein S16
MKKMGRRHRPFFRICAMDSRTPRDGRAIEELGTYDPMVRDKDERVSLNAERVRYWLSVGAKPSENVAVLIKKYLPEGESQPTGAAEPTES